MIKIDTRTNCLLFIIWLVASYPLNANEAAKQKLLANLDHLTSPMLAGRKAGSEQPSKSSSFVLNRFKKLGWNTRYQEFEFRNSFFRKSVGRNIIAQLPCDQLVCGNEVIITAHYDHLGGTKESYFPGANDNASGVAALFYLAESIQNNPRHFPVTLLATDAEELGLYGAKHFVTTIDLNKVALNINLDMLAVNKKSTLYILHSKAAKPQAKFLSAINSDPIKVITTRSQIKLHRLLGDNRINWHKASDHYPFHKSGIPYMYFGMGLDKHHHKKSDTLENIDFDKYYATVDFISRFVNTLLSSPPDATH